MKKLLLFPIMFLLLAGFASAALNDAGMYLSFDDDDLTGNDPDDISGNGYSITNDGATTGATGILLEAFDFDGTNDHLDGTLPGFASQSISWWADVDTWTNGDFFFNRNNANGYFCQITGSGSMACYYETSTASGWKGGSVSGITTTGWNHFVLTGTDGDVDLWVNGVQNHLTSTSFTRTATDDVGVIGAHNSGSSGFFDGTMDEMAMYDRVLSSSEISDLYNSGSGYNPYSAPAATDNLTISISDAWDSSALTNVSATLEGQTFSNTTGNIIYTNISQNASVLTDINLTAENYFNGTQTNVNISSNQAFTLFQSQIEFNATELLTGNALTGVTFTVSANTDNPKYMKAGNYTVTASKSGYFDQEYEFTVNALDNTTITVPNLGNAQINFTAVNNATGSSINNFSVTLYHSGTNTTLEYSTTTGLISANVVQDEFEVQAFGSELTSQEFNLTINQTNTDYEIGFYELNSFIIQIFDVDTDELITSLAEINIISSLFSNNYTTTTGSLNVSLLDPAIYTIEYSAINYTSSNYYLTLQNDTVEFIDLYLTPNSSVTEITVTVKDEATSPVEDAVVKLLEYDLSSNSYTVVDMQTTSFEGIVYFDVKEDGTKYKFIVEVDGLVVSETSGQELKKSSYTLPVVLTQQIGTYVSTVNGIDGDVRYSYDSEEFTFSYNTPGIQYTFCLQVEDITNLNNYIEVSNDCQTGSSGTITSSLTPTNGSNYRGTGTVTVSGNTVYVDQAYANYKDAQDFSTEGLIITLMALLLTVVAFMKYSSWMPFAMSVVLAITRGLNLHQFSWELTVTLMVVTIIIGSVVHNRRIG